MLRTGDRNYKEIVSKQGIPTIHINQDHLIYYMRTGL